MKWLRLRTWAYPVLHLLGLAGIGLTLTYVFYSDRLNYSGPLNDIWIGFGIELVMVWIGVTAIDAIIGARRAAKETRDELRGFINFIGHILRDMPPEYYHWRLGDLADELRWARERVLPLSTKFLTASEREEVGALILAAQDVHDGANRVRHAVKAVRKASRAVDVALAAETDDRGRPARYRHEFGSLDRVEQDYRIAMEDPDLQEAEIHDLERSVDLARRGLAMEDSTQEIADAINSYIMSMWTVIQERMKIEPTISRYRSIARRLEPVLSPV